jgi:hypothetical protein
MEESKGPLSFWDQIHGPLWHIVLSISWSDLNSHASHDEILVENDLKVAMPDKQDVST